MALARARCIACTLPLGDQPHAKVAGRCMRCGVVTEVAVAADGQPVDFDAMFGAQRLLMWFAAARIAMANGTPGVAVGACVKCSTPLVVPSAERVSLPCPHCQEPVTGSAEVVLMDLWPEPWAKITGAGLDLEYRLEMVDDTTGITAGCAVCGLPTPSNDDAMRCRRCNAAVWVAREAPTDGGDAAAPARPRRVQLGVRVNGTRGGLPFKALVPVVQGEAMLRSDAAVGSSDSGKLFLNVGGVGCAVLAAITIVLALVIGFCSTR
jgi:hypothetical protein